LIILLHLRDVEVLLVLQQGFLLVSPTHGSLLLCTAPLLVEVAASLLVLVTMLKLGGQWVAGLHQHGRSGAAE